MAAVLGQMHMYGWNGWNGWWMGLGMLLFWVVLIGAVVALVVALTRSGARGARDDGRSRARDLLAERYAAGEIDTEEFLTRSRELEKAGK